MMDDAVSASVQSLITQAQVDYSFMRCLKGEYDEESMSVDILNMAKYFAEDTIPLWITTGREVAMNGFLTYLMAHPNSTVVFSPYVLFTFKVTCDGNVQHLPPVFTRALLYLLRTFNVKCVVEKRHKSLCNIKEACIIDYVFTGKSDISIPEIKPLADACKRIKVRLSPWIKEDAVEEDNTEEISEASIRFRGAEWFTKTQQDVTLIGCGGLGSNISTSLCRVLGSSSLALYDGDLVEHKNLAGQNFGISDIGRGKSCVVAGQARNFNPSIIVGIKGRYGRGCSLFPIVITGLDNMATRHVVYYDWIALNSSQPKLLIDARLSAEKWQIFCITGGDKAAQKEYEDKWLFGDEEADSDVCSYKQTAYAAQMCASFVTNLYINFCSNTEKAKDDPLRRYLPFMTEYDASQMILRHKEI